MNDIQILKSKINRLWAYLPKSEDSAHSLLNEILSIVDSMEVTSDTDKFLMNLERLDNVGKYPNKIIWTL